MYIYICIYIYIEIYPNTQYIDTYHIIFSCPCCFYSHLQVQLAFPGHGFGSIHPTLLQDVLGSLHRVPGHVRLGGRTHSPADFHGKLLGFRRDFMTSEWDLMGDSCFGLGHTHHTPSYDHFSEGNKDNLWI